ncbi:MAG TPA: glycosyltransferase [Hydrogenobaculum sp.]|nr:glycosyltransferase [Hydrogenobaculum sp.]
MPKAKKTKKPTILIADVFASDPHNNAPFMGGGQKMILKLYELLKKDFDITLMSSQKLSLEKAKELGAKTISLYYPEEKVFEEFEKYIDEIKKYDFFIINNQLPVDIHPNTIAWVHADYFSFCTPAEIEDWLNFAKSPNVKYIVFVSEPLKNSFLLKSDIPKEKIKVIPNWIEYIEKSPKPYSENFRVVWIGTLKPDKDWQELSQALKGTDIDVDFLGDGQDLIFAKELKEMKPNLFSHQNFLGFVDDPISYMKEHSSVFVFTSKAKYESFGLTLIEAMSVGIPCVAYKTDITKYVLGEEGLFYSTKEELKDIIFKLKSDKALYEEKAKYSLERAKLFYKDHVKKLWEEILKSS